MSKSKDIHFDDINQFMIDNPSLIIVETKPNIPVIRGILKAGRPLKGVRLLKEED